mgnify:FL=1
MTTTTQEEVFASGVPWPVVVTHRSMDILASLPSDAAKVLRLYDAKVEPRFGGPSTAEALAEWADYHPAAYAPLLEAVLATQRPSVRERLLCRIHVFHRPGDGVWELAALGSEAADLRDAQELGFDIHRPMARPYGTRWDTHADIDEAFNDGIVDARQGRGLGCHIHPSKFLVLCPRLRPVFAYHNLARPGNSITMDEYQTFTAFEVMCHRELRDAIARRRTS